MKRPTITTGKLITVNLAGLACLLILVYFDKAILGLGICLTLNGLLSLVAFIYDTDPLWMSVDIETFFKWLFEDYWKKALNLVYTTTSLIFGIAALIKEFS